jgi:hypothetical protein
LCALKRFRRGFNTELCSDEPRLVVSRCEESRASKRIGSELTHWITVFYQYTVGIEPPVILTVGIAPPVTFTVGIEPPVTNTVGIAPPVTVAVGIEPPVVYRHSASFTCGHFRRGACRRILRYHSEVFLSSGRPSYPDAYSGLGRGEPAYVIAIRKTYKITRNAQTSSRTSFAGRS